MKLLLENWRKYLKEEDNLEQNIYSFDFDNTLIRYHTLEDGDVEYLGPHDKYINILRQLADDGHKVVIVTSRSPLKGNKPPWDDAPTPEELVADLNLPVEIIEYTRGNLKTQMLLKLGVSHHWDDDQEEVDAAIEAGLRATKVPVPGEETQRLRAKWSNHLANTKDETN